MKYTMTKAAAKRIRDNIIKSIDEDRGPLLDTLIFELHSEGFVQYLGMQCKDLLTYWREDSNPKTEWLIWRITTDALWALFNERDERARLVCALRPLFDELIDDRKREED